MASPVMARPRARERDLFEGLAGLAPAGVVVIGGYAVSARSIPRYSRDIDIVLDPAVLDSVRSFLTSRHFKKTRSREGFEQNYGGSWERWERAKAGSTVDLLPASVQDRGFQVPMPYVRVARGSTMIALRGLEPSRVRLPVASREVLIALKLQPLRDKDLGDIACLAASGYAPAALRRLVTPLVSAQRTRYIERVEALATRLARDPTAAMRFLGSRIPGPQAGRERAVAAVAKLAADLAEWGRG